MSEEDRLLNSLLEGESQAHELPDDAAQRVWDRLETQFFPPGGPGDGGGSTDGGSMGDGGISAGGAGASSVAKAAGTAGAAKAVGTAGTVKVAGAAASGSGLFAKAALGLALAGGGTYAVTSSGPHEQPAPTAAEDSAASNQAQHVERAPDEENEPPKRSSEPEVELDEEPPEVAEPLKQENPKVRKAPSSKETTEPETPVNPILRELGLLKEIRAAIASGQLSAANQLIAEHAKEFPNGRLAIEREVARVRVLCSSGSVAQAKNVAQRLANSSPGSVHRLDPDSPCDPK